MVEHDGVTRPVDVALHGDRRTPSTSTPRSGHLALRALPRFVDPADVVAGGSLLAPMPGTVMGVPVDRGRAVVARATRSWCSRR